MMRSIQAIPGYYGGYFMRSQLEIKMAKEFDNAKLEWQYEPLHTRRKGIYYQPDFWFPKLSALVEIKPTRPNKKEQQKITDYLEDLEWNNFLHVRIFSVFIADEDEDITRARLAKDIDDEKISKRIDWLMINPDYTKITRLLKLMDEHRLAAIGPGLPADDTWFGEIGQ